MTIDVVAPPGAVLGEGALWDSARGVLWWTDIKGRMLHAHAAGSGRNHAQSLDRRVTALALARGGGLVAAADGGVVAFAVGDDLRVTIGETLAATPAAEPAGNRWNDGKVDAAGRFWIGTMDDAEEAPRGTLYRLDRDRRLTAVRDTIMVPNGPAFLADGTMLATDSARRTIHAVTLDDAGMPRDERVFARFDDTHGYPDGMTVDAEDHVWVAFWDGWCVRRLSPAGDVVAEIALPMQRPTCPAFGGDALDRLYVTSATVGLSPDELAAQPSAGGLLRLDVGVTGRAPHVYAG